MAALAVSPSFVNNTRTLSSTSLPDKSYLLSIAPLQSHYAAAASAPSNVIHLFDKSDCKTVVRALPGHDGGTSNIRTATSFQGAREMLLSCGKDGSVKAWDERSGTVGVQMLTTGRKAGLLSCDASPNGFLVAAGTVLQGDDASILYWDPRNPVAPLRRHSSTHSDDITAVHFAHSGSTAALLSASTDGLVCTSNPLEEDEDEASLSVGNWGCSISKAGWVHGGDSANGPKVWAVSDMETISMWSDDLDIIQNVDRDRFAYPDAALPWVSDYIIDCHSSRRGSFHVFTGSNEGDIALISPREEDAHWSLEQLYTAGHSEVVRCIHWDESSGLLLTGGEDSKLNVWSSPVHFDENSNGGRSMEVDSPPRKRIIGDGGENEYKRVRTL
ncbi:WD40 repeat-like protein [Phellopilus nigrolimitatus]|nr:WD40 repeat-like protein [Phellopilus nigrolimitatus]